MNRIGMVVLLTVIAGIGFVPATVYSGGHHGRTDWEERRYVEPDDPYPSERCLQGQVRQEYQVIQRAPDLYESAEVPYHRSCEKPIVRAKPQVIRVPCPKPGHAKATQRTTVIVNNYPSIPAVKPAPKPKKTKPICVDPCPKQLQNAITELQDAKSELQNRDSELREFERELGALQQSIRDNQAWQSHYQEWYREFRAWQARSK